MKFLATYVHREGKEESYYRTIFEDSIGAAMKQAARWTRKGYMCVRLTQQLNGVY